MRSSMQLMISTNIDQYQREVQYWSILFNIYKNMIGTY